MRSPSDGMPWPLGPGRSLSTPRFFSRQVVDRLLSSGLPGGQCDGRLDVQEDVTRLAAEVAGTKRPGAAEALKEIHALIARLTANPTLSEIAHLRAFIRHDATITAAEEDPRLNIREPLLKALESLKP